ncbi:hypothetical protein V6N13_148369 [Hibiscus sabdariffa]
MDGFRIRTFSDRRVEVVSRSLKNSGGDVSRLEKLKRRDVVLNKGIDEQTYKEALMTNTGEGNGDEVRVKIAKGSGNPSGDIVVGSVATEAVQIATTNKDQSRSVVQRLRMSIVGLMARGRIVTWRILRVEIMTDLGKCDGGMSLLRSLRVWKRETKEVEKGHDLGDSFSSDQPIEEQLYEVHVEGGVESNTSSGHIVSIEPILDPVSGLYSITPKLITRSKRNNLVDLCSSLINRPSRVGFSPLNNKGSNWSQEAEIREARHEKLLRKADGGESSQKGDTSMAEARFSLELCENLGLTFNEEREDFKCALINVYGSHNVEERIHMFDELIKCTNVLQVLVIIVGDFNIIRTKEEKIGVIFQISAVREFSDFIETMSLVGIPLTRDDKDYVKCIEKVCLESRGLGIGNILKNCKRVSKDWVSNLAGESNARIKEVEGLYELLEQKLAGGIVDSLTVSDLKEARGKLWALIRREE